MDQLHEWGKLSMQDMIFPLKTPAFSIATKSVTVSTMHIDESSRSVEAQIEQFTPSAKLPHISQAFSLSAANPISSINSSSLVRLSTKR